MKGWERLFHANRNEREAGIAILISEKIDFKTNSAVGDKDRHYIMIMESIQHENITFVDICASNIGEHKCIKQI